MPAWAALRGWFVIGAIGVAITALGAVYWLVRESGVQAERTANAIEDQTDATDATKAGLNASQGVADATDAFARTSVRIKLEADHGRDQIRALPPGGVAVAGPDARVRADLARVLVCRVERVRAHAEPDPAACGGAAAAAGPDPSAGHQ